MTEVEEDDNPFVEIKEGTPRKPYPQIETPPCPACGGRSFDVDVLRSQTQCNGCGWTYNPKANPSS